MGLEKREGIADKSADSRVYLMRSESWFCHLLAVTLSKLNDLTSRATVYVVKKGLHTNVKYKEQCTWTQQVLHKCLLSLFLFNF